MVRICRYLQGMPLAIELSASWLKLLPCETIAVEMQQHFELLHTGIRNMPERHRSMRAVFDHSWELLSDHERTCFAQLSVFSGGFDREAAERVASTPLWALSTLADKSMVQVQPNERYALHELLRQYAGEQLRSSPMGVKPAWFESTSFVL